MAIIHRMIRGFRIILFVVGAVVGILSLMICRVSPGHKELALYRRAFFVIWEDGFRNIGLLAKRLCM